MDSYCKTLMLNGFYKWVEGHLEATVKNADLF